MDDAVLLVLVGFSYEVVHLKYNFKEPVNLHDRHLLPTEPPDLPIQPLSPDLTVLLGRNMHIHHLERLLKNRIVNISIMPMNLKALFLILLLLLISQNRPFLVRNTHVNFKRFKM